MKRLGLGKLVYAGIVRCTATSESLLKLANALDFGGPWSFDEVLVEHQVRLRAKSGDSTRLEEDGLTLALADCPALSSALRKLAIESDRSEFSLAGIGLLKLEVPLKDFDLVFYKMDETIQLKNDYKIRNIGGGTWEAVVYHDPPNLDQFEKAREAILEWAIPTSEGFEKICYAQTHEESVAIESSMAYSRLLDAENDVFQISMYLEHPLKVGYSSPHTQAKVWFYEEMSEIILSQHCSWSGDLSIDIENFFSYREVLRSLAKALNANTVAWGDTADGWPAEKRILPNSLDDGEALWGIFNDGLEPMLSDLSILSPWRSKFDQNFEASLAE